MRALVGGFCLALVSVLLAGPLTGDARAVDAEALIREGIELRRAGDDASALRRFQQAYDIGKAPRAMAQIGLAEQALGRWADADRHLRQALEDGARASGERDPWVRKYRAEIDRALAVVSEHVGHLDVTGTPAGAEVRVDGRLAGLLPLAHPIAAAAGGVAVELSAPGYLPIARTTTVRVGSLTRESFDLQPSAPRAGLPTAPEPPWAAPASAASPPADIPDDAAASRTAADQAAPAPGNTVSSRRVLVVTGAALSAVALAFGIYQHVTWQGKVDSFGTTGGCGQNLPDRGGPGCQQLYDDGQRARTFAFAGYGIAAGLAAAATVLYLTEPTPAPPPRTQLACAPVPGGAGFGLHCGFRF